MKFFFILFLSLISCAFSINIGYIIPKDDAYDVEEALNKYTSKVNGLLEGDAQFVVKSISSYDSTTEKLQNTFDTFLSDDVKIIVAYCDNTIYEYDFADNYKDLLVWCINPIAPRLCKRNLIAGDLINYSLEMITSLIIYQFFPNFVYIGGTDNTINEVVSEQLILLSESVGMTLIANLNHDINATSIKKALDLCLTYQSTDGCTIITNANTVEVYDEILSDIQNAVEDPNKKIQLGLLSSGINNKIISQISSTNKLYLNQVGAINSFTELSTAGNDITDYTDLTTNHYYPDLEAHIIGIINILKKAYEIVQSKDPFILLSAVYNIPVDYVGGKIMVRENHYTTTNNYIVTLDGTGKHASLTSTVDLDTLNGPINIFGKATTQKCNFIKNIDDGIITNDIVVILFIHELSPSTIFYDRTVRIASLEAIRNINSNGGVLGKTITPLYMSVNQYNDLNTFVNDVNKEIIEQSISAVFFSGNVTVRDCIINNIKNTNVELFYLDYTDGNICESNIVFTGLSGTNMIFETVRYIAEHNMDNITIIGSTSTRGKSLVKLLKSELAIYGKSSSISLLIKDDGIDMYYEAKVIIDRLIQLYNNDLSDGGLIINTAEDVYNEAIYSTLYKNNITLENGWKSISYSLDELQSYYINKITGANMKGYSFISHYLDILKNKEMEKIKLHFKKSFVVDIPISNRLVIAYNSINYWISACELASSVEASLYRFHLYQNALDINKSPGGIYTIEYSGYSAMVLRIGRLISNTETIIVKNNTYVHTTNIFHNDSFICTWKDNIGAIVKNTYVVGIIYDIKTYDGIQYLDNVQLIIDLINYDGGINGRNIDVYVDSDFNGNYTDTILKLAKNPYLIGYIGTINKEERDEVNNALEIVDKLLISPHQSVGEVTYKNIIQFNAITNQFVEFPLISFYQTHQCVIAFLENNTIGQSIGHYIINKATPLGFYPNITYVNTSDEDSETDIILDILESNLTNVDKCAIFTFLDNMTGPFLNMIDGKYDENNYPVIMLDYPKSLLEKYFNSNSSISKSILLGRYLIVITSLKVQTSLNKKIYDNINIYKGNPYDLISSVTAAIYNAIHAVQLTMNDNIRTSSDMRNCLYNTEIETGVGNIRLYRNNYVSNYIYILHLISEEFETEFYANSIYPIYPQVWNSFDHNNDYYTTDFINGTEMMLEDFIGIAFILDTENYESSKALYRYYLGILDITKQNIQSDIQFKRIEGELYNCPKSSSQASGLLIELNRRGFKLLIGGCNMERENYLEDGLSLLNMILFYTGLNEGNRCSKNVIFATASPNQRVIPPLLYLLSEIENEFVLLYDEKFTFCSSLIENVALTLDYKLEYTKKILESEMHNMFLRYLTNIIKKYTSGIPIVFIGSPVMTEDLLSTIFTILKDEFNNSMLEITNIYPIYVYDLESTRFENIKIADGVYIFSPFLYNNNEKMNNEFFINYKNYTGNLLSPTYYDAIYPTIITIISDALKNTKDIDDITELRKTLYLIESETVIGKVKISNDNVLSQGNWLGRVNNRNGLVESITKLNYLWKGEPWKSGLNEKPYYICNEIIFNNNNIMIGDKIEPNTVNIGIIFPSDIDYKRNGLLLVETVILMTDFMNDKIENNEISSNYYLVPYYISVSSSNCTKSLEIVKNFTEFYDIDALFGGWTTELRIALNNYVKENNKLLFYFYDYEGRECLGNVFYFANPFSTYYTITPWIKNNYPSFGIILVYSLTVTSISIAEQIKSEFAVYGINILYEYESPIDNDNFTPLTNLVKRIASNGAIFLSFLEGSSSILLLKAINEEGLIPPTYFSLSLNIDYLSIDKSLIGQFYTITIDPDKITSNEYKAFKSRLHSYFTYHTVTVQNIVRPASLISIFYNMYVKSKFNSNSEILRDLILDNKHDTAAGVISFLPNNHIEYNIRIRKVIESDNKNVDFGTLDVFDSSIVFIPRPYESFFEDIPFYQCNIRESIQPVEISKIYIGLVFMVSDLTDCDNSALNGAISALRSINDEGLLNGYLFIPKVIGYIKIIDSVIINKVNDLLDMDNVIGIIGCVNIDCKNQIQPLAINKKKPFIYPKQSLGQECNYYTLYSGLVPNQYMSRLLQFILTLDLNQNVYYIGNSNNNDTDLFFDIFSDASNGLLLHQNDLFINDSYGLSTERITRHIFTNENNENGGVIIVYLSSTEAIRFIELCYDIKVDKSKWGIFLMGIEIEEIIHNNNIMSTDVLDSVYIISHYFSDVESDINVKTKQTIYHYSTIADPSALFISSYVSIMLMRNAILDSKNNMSSIFDWNKLRKNMYYQTIDFGVGTITLQPNHHVDLPFFVAKYSSINQKFQTVYSKLDHSTAEAWSWYLPDYTGKKCNYDGEGEMYDVKILRILLVGSITGKESDENGGIVDVYQLVIDEVNELGGVKDFILKGDMYDTQSNSEYCSNYILQYKTQYNPLLILLASDEKCLEKVIYNEEDSTTFYLVLNQINIGYCKTNVILSGLHPTFYENILDVLINRKYDNYLLIASTFYYVTDFVSLYFKKYGYKFYEPLVFDTVITSEQLTSYLKKFMTKSPKSESNIIIFVGYNPQFVILQEVMKNLHLSEPYINLISLYMYYELKKESYIGFEGVTGYNYQLQSNVNKLFIENMQQRLGSNDIITDSIERSYSSFRLFIEIMNKSVELIYSSIKESLFDVKYESPEGEVSLAVNQQIKRKLIIFKIDKDAKETITFQTGELVEPKIYYNTDSTYQVCDFTDDTLGENGLPTTYKIGLLYSITGEWKDTEIQIFHSILLGITNINEKKYFGDIYIVYELYDTKSSIQGYIDGFNKFKENEKILYVFGGSNHDTYLSLVSLFEKVNKIFFFTGINYNAECYSHTYTVSKHPSQIAESSLHYIIELTTNIVLLHSPNSEYSKVIYQWIYNRFTNVSIGIIGNVEYTTASNSVRSINTILRNGGYILNILSDEKENLDFFNEMCKSKLLPTKYTIISVLIDENLIHKVDNMKCMQGNILLDTYFESLGNELLSEVGVINLATSFNTALHSLLGLDIKITSLHESAYSGILIWSNAISKLSSVDQYNISKFKNVYTVTNSVPSDSIDVEKNNLFSRRFFAATINNNNKLVIKYGPKSVINPNIFDQYKNTTGWFCDVTREDNIYSYYSDALYIAFIHEKDVGVKTEVYMSLVEDVTIRDINENGGVLNHKLIGIHFFPSKHLIYSQVRDIVQSNKYQIIIGCMTSYCRDEVSRYVNRNDNDMLFIDTGRDNGNRCFRKTVITGTTISQKLPLLLDYLKDIGISNIIIIGSNDEYAVIEANDIYNKTINAGYNIQGVYYCSAYNQGELAGIFANITDIVSRIGRVGVFNLFESNENQVLTEYLVVLGARFNVFNMIYFKFEPFEFTDEILSKLTGSFVVSSYSTVLSATTSDTFSYSLSTKFSKYNEMSESIESAYDAIMLWKSALEYSTTQTKEPIPSRAYVRLSYFNIRMESPSGSVSILHNNHLSKSVSIFKINEDHLDLVTPRQGVKYIPSEILYGISSNECTFDKDESQYQYNDAISPLIIILAVINYFLACCVSLLVRLFKHTKVIISASPTFIYYTLVALVLIATEGLMFTFRPTESWVCIVRVWGLSLSVLFLFSILFSKAWRIHKLFNNKQLARVKISNKQLLQMIGMMMFCELIYLTIWWVCDQSKPTLRLGVTYSDYLENVYLVECTQNDYFVIIQVVLLFMLFCYGGKLAWSVRNAASDFNESMSLAMTIALLCIMGIIEVPLNYLMIDDPNVLLVFRGIGIELGATFIIIIQFGSKVTYLWIHEIASTTGGSSLSGPTDNSGKSGSKTNLVHQRNNIRNSSCTNYTIEPDLLKCGDMTLCSLSNPELFFLEAATNINSSKLSKRQSSNQIVVVQ